MTIRESDFEAFRSAFDATLRALLTPEDLQLRIETDGTLSAQQLSLSLAGELSAPVWGQGFPQPRFRGDFHVEDQRVVGGRHLRFALTSIEARARPVNGVLFGTAEPLPDAIRAVFRLDVDEYNGARSLQLVLDHWQQAD